MEESVSKNDGKLVTFTVLSRGVDITNQYRFRSIKINREVNRIGNAVLKVVAGEMPQSDVTESSADHFKPGQNIKIELGYENENLPVFEGIVVSQKINVAGDDHSGMLLIVECKHEAVKATVTRKNKVFEKSSDSDAALNALKSNGLSATMESTPVQHKQLVQYYCTDWDFALSRADAYGMLAVTDGSKVTIEKPKVSVAPLFKVTYGVDLLSFDGELCAEDQFSSVKGVGWDPVSQKVVSVSSSPVSLNEQGNINSKQMASMVGTDEVLLQSDAQGNSNVLKAWVDSNLLKTGLSRFTGTFTFRGCHKVVPGCIIELDGMGARFNGKVFVGGLTHKVSDGAWVTEVQMGISPMNITQQADVVAPAASGLYPGIEGLHIGIVSKLEQDSESNYRIQVKVPALGSSVIWARLSQFAASKNVGSFFIPSVSDEVILGFINNDPNQAVILGCMYSSSHVPPYSLEDKNYKRAIISPEKLKIELDDEKKVITVTTPGKNSIIINDDAKSITLQDQHKNEIVMNNSGIKISSAKDIILNAKGNIQMEAIGKVTTKGKQGVTIEGLTIEAKAQTTLKLNGAAMAELSASGQTVVKGAMVMIN